MTDRADSSSSHDPVVRLERWRGPWEDDDSDANFKADLALHTLSDPMETIGPFAEALDIPVGAVCRYVLCKWSSEGAAALLELGPSMVERLWRFVEEAEEAGTDEARLQAYEGLKARIGWLRSPLQAE